MEFMLVVTTTMDVAREDIKGSLEVQELEAGEGLRLLLECCLGYFEAKGRRGLNLAAEGLSAFHARDN